MLNLIINFSQATNKPRRLSRFKTFNKRVRVTTILINRALRSSITQDTTVVVRTTKPFLNATATVISLSVQDCIRAGRMLLSHMGTTTSFTVILSSHSCNQWGSRCTIISSRCQHLASLLPIQCNKDACRMVIIYF